MLRDGDIIGIIHFASFSKVTLGLTQIRNQKDRDFILRHALPRGFSNRQANFWSALSLGIISLRNSPDDELPDGATFILITDALELENYPKKTKILEQLKAYDITVDTISFSFEADQHLELLSRKTNGLSYRLSNNYLYHALKEISNRDLEQSLRTSIIFSNYLTVESENILFFNINIDESITSRQGGFIRFKFQVDFGQSMPSIEIKEPKTHRIYSTYQNELCKQLQDNVNDTPYNYIICNIKNPQNGLWDVRILNNFFESLNVQTIVSSFIANNNELSESSVYSLTSNQINVEALWKYNIVHYPQMQVLYVMLSREHRPILDAHVEAIVYRPNGEQITIELFDDGLHADRYKNDGVYSRYFIDYSVNGPYCALVRLLGFHRSEITGVQKNLGKSLT
jgi:calcium-activated chloride channel regulator 3/4